MLGPPAFNRLGSWDQVRVCTVAADAAINLDAAKREPAGAPPQWVPDEQAPRCMQVGCYVESSTGEESLEVGDET